MNLFTIPPGDQSVAYLGRIFGHVGSVLPAAGNAPLLLGAMFKTFNTVMLTLGALVIVYTTVVGLLATAHEGEFMGKKWSGLWVPLRSLIGIVALFPTTTGYSALQVVVMWVVLQGIGAADMLWNTVLSYSQIAGSPLTQASMTRGLGIDHKIAFIFQGLTCQSTSLYQDKWGDMSLYYCSDHKGEAYCKQTEDDLFNLSQRSKLSSDGTLYIYSMGPDGACGAVSYCNPDKACVGGSGASVPDQIKCVACKAQVAALTQIVPTLGKVASSFSKIDNDYLVFLGTGKKQAPEPVKQFCDLNKVKSEECCLWKWKPGALGMPVPDWCEGMGILPAYGVDKDEWTSPSEKLVKQIYWPFGISPQLNGADFLKVSTTFYVTTLSGALTTFMATLKPELLTEWRKEAQENGWIVAGTFYNALANAQSQGLDNAKPNFEANAMIDASNPMAKYRNNVKGADFLRNQFTESNASMPSPVMTRLTNDLNGLAESVFTEWQKSMQGGPSGGVNPLVQLHNFGKDLLITAEVLYPLVLIAAVAAGAADISFIALGTGPIGLMAWLKYLILVGFLPMAFAILGICLTFGGLLAVYIPLIPYVVFTLTALGWFISTIEAMVASPLIALGILSPGGQHEILGKSEGALMLLLGVLLRPSLMIFGLMAAMLLSYASLYLVNSTFARAMSEITHHPSITELVLFLAAYTFLIIAILNKCFSMIHLIPERVMTWIGGQAVSYGEGEGLGEVKRGAEGAGAGAAGMAKGAGGQVQSGLARKEKEQRGARDKPKGEGGGSAKP